MRGRFVVGFGIASLVLVTAANAQDVGLAAQSASPFIDAISGLTLEDAVARALDREPSLRAARTSVDAALGMQRQAALRPNPSLTALQQQEPGGADNQTSVEVQWPLDLFRKPARMAVATQESESARQAVNDRERVLA